MTDYPLENGRSPLGPRYRAKAAADYLSMYPNGAPLEVSAAYFWNWAADRGADFKPCRLKAGEEIDPDAVKARCGPVVEVEEAKVQDNLKPEHEGAGG